MFLGYIRPPNNYLLPFYNSTVYLKLALYHLLYLSISRLIVLYYRRYSEDLVLHGNLP